MNDSNLNAVQHEPVTLAAVRDDGDEDRELLEASDSPFRLVIDPEVRENMRDALIKLIDCHDEELAKLVAQRRLALDSYKEYIELFARSLRECMESREGVAYLLKSCGFEVPLDKINLEPEWRWRS